MTVKKYRPKKGHYCIIYTRAYDAWPAGWRVVRIVKVSKNDLITHVVPNRNWTKSIKANDGNSLAGNFTEKSEENHLEVLTISTYAEFDLSDLDGDIYQRTSQVRDAITTG